MLKCKYCNNKDPTFFYFKNEKPYCKKCVGFIGNKVNYKESKINNYKYELTYKLTKKQNKISNGILKSFKKGKNVLVHAVCGAGKTELLFKTIGYALSKSMKIGFAIPRKDVVVDLIPRFKNTFKNNKIIGVYGGHTDNLEGDIILLTTHQLYRYNDYFDLLIIDETDAFPYCENEVLNNMFLKAVKGSYVMLSATPTKDMVKKIEDCDGDCFELFERYHKKSLPVPKLVLTIVEPLPFLIKYLNDFIRDGLPVLIFVPTIQEAERLFKVLKMLNSQGEFVSSKNQNRDKIINDFKNKKYSYLITTSILERGITIKNLQVVVYNSDNKIFDKKTLIQISGRVGRKIDATQGEVIFLSRTKSEDMISAIEEIENANK